MKKRINFYKIIFLQRLNGHSNKEIADAYCVSVRTVEGYLEKLRLHYNAKNLIHLAGLMIHSEGISKKSFSTESLDAREIDPNINTHVVFDGESITIFNNNGG
jgi:DNA-binding CsgD family transcriptional regulator